MKTPRNYQKTATRFMTTRPGAILGDRVGLGKTASAIWAALDVYEHIEQTPMLVLVVCPRLHKDFWIEEIQELVHIEGVVSEEQDGTPILRTTDQHYDIVWVFAHYEQFQGRGNQPSHLTSRYLSTHWHIVICDEAHKIKNRKAQRAKWIKKLRTQYRWGLTASLAAEYAKDMWSVLNWIDPQNFPYYWPWIESYCYVYGEHGGKQATNVKPNLLPSLRQELAPFFLVRTLEDVGLELPPLTITDVPIEISKEHADFYDQVRTQVLVELTEVQTQHGLLDLTQIGKDVLLINSQIGRFTRLAQTLSDPSVFGQDVPQHKFEWLGEFVENGGGPALVFARFNHTVEEIIRFLRDKGMLVNEVDKSGKWAKDSWIVGTWAKFSESHNLQHLNQVIAWDTPLAYLQWEQGLGRTHRSGQTHPVQVYRLISKLPKPYSRRHSVEQQIASLIDRKGSTNQLLMSWLRGIYDDKL